MEQGAHWLTDARLGAGRAEWWSLEILRVSHQYVFTTFVKYDLWYLLGKLSIYQYPNAVVGKSRHCQVPTTTELDHRLSHIMTRRRFTHGCKIRWGNSEEYSLNESSLVAVTTSRCSIITLYWQWLLLPFHGVRSWPFIKRNMFSTSSTCMQWLDMQTDPVVHCQVLSYKLADTAYFYHPRLQRINADIHSAQRKLLLWSDWEGL